MAINWERSFIYFLLLDRVFTGSSRFTQNIGVLHLWRHNVASVRPFTMEAKDQYRFNISAWSRYKQYIHPHAQLRIKAPCVLIQRLYPVPSKMHKDLEFDRRPLYLPLLYNPSIDSWIGFRSKRDLLISLPSRPWALCMANYFQWPAMI